jgi:hypothetical protein
MSTAWPTQRARLRDWKVRNCGWQILEGYVFGHPQIRDGSYVYTSELMFLDESIGIAATRDTVYVLRDMDDEAGMVRRVEQRQREELAA